MSQRKGRIAAVITIAAVGVLATGSQAVGVDQPQAPLATNIARDSITSYHIGTSGISQQNDLSAPLQNLLRTPKANSVSSWNLVDSGVAEQDLTAAVRTKLNKVETLGGGQVMGDGRSDRDREHRWVVRHPQDQGRGLQPPRPVPG